MQCDEVLQSQRQQPCDLEHTSITARYRKADHFEGRMQGLMRSLPQTAGDTTTTQPTCQTYATEVYQC